MRCLDFARSIDEALEFFEGVAPIDGRSAATMRRWNLPERPISITGEGWLAQTSETLTPQTSELSFQLLCAAGEKKLYKNLETEGL